MQYNQDIQNEIIKIDISKTASCSLILAIISFFVHLMLHNYNDFKKNHLEEAFYTGQIAQYSSPASEVAKDPILTTPLTITPSLQKDVSQNTLPKKDKLAIIANDKTTEKKHMKSKRIGNMVIISMSKGDTLIDALKEAKIANPNAIVNAVSNKYKLSNIKVGDVLQIGYTSRDVNLNLRLVLVNKVEILIKEKRKQYIVLVKSLQQKQSQQSSEVKKNIINLSQQSIQKSQFAQDLKRDLAMIVQLLKHVNIDSSKLEVIYEKISSKSEKLLYVNVSNLRIYKYKDRNGITHYVQQNGILLSNEARKKPLQVTNFKLSYPINKPVIGSGFGMRRHPIMGGHKMHKGVDFRACKGTPIQAPADGIITQISSGRGFGKHIRMRHNGVYTTLYAHLDRFASDKKVGMKIKKGDIIGYVGKTGIASGEHLHFEVHENGRPINPMRLISSTPTVNHSTVKQLDKRQLISFKNYQSEVDKKVKLL